MSPSLDNTMLPPAPIHGITRAKRDAAATGTAVLQQLGIVTLNICNTSGGIRKSRVNHREFTVIDALHTVCYKLLQTTQPQSMKSEVNPTV